MIVLAIACGLTRAQAPDASTPKAAAKSLRAAVDAADDQAVRRLLLVDNDPEQKLAGAYAGLILAGKNLADAARQKFPTAADAFTQGTIRPEDSARIDAASVSIDGDSATLVFADGNETMKLRRIDGAWRIVVAQEPDKSTPGHRAEQYALVQGLADAINQCAEDIKSDKFADVDDAKNAVKDRVGTVLARAMQSNPPTSRPTTAATQP